MAGTDVPAEPGRNPLHDELKLLVEAGLTPMEALQTATRNPARYFGILKETGTIEAGKSADMLLLDADPLADIQNTQKINAVVSRGRYYSRQDLDAMLERTAALSATVH
jgi:imidazolonepropionase-like amidohydrolase